MRNKSNAAVQANVRCFGRISGQVGPWFYGTYLDQTGDGKGWKRRGDQIIIVGGGKVGDDIKYLIKTFWNVCQHPCYWCEMMDVLLLFKSAVWGPGVLRLLKGVKSNGSFRKWLCHHVKKTISSFGPKNKIVWCTYVKCVLGGIYENSQPTLPKVSQ